MLITLKQKWIVYIIERDFFEKLSYFLLFCCDLLIILGRALYLVAWHYQGDLWSFITFVCNISQILIILWPFWYLTFIDYMLEESIKDPICLFHGALLIVIIDVYVPLPWRILIPVKQFIINVWVITYKFIYLVNAWRRFFNFYFLLGLFGKLTWNRGTRQFASLSNVNCYFLGLILILGILLFRWRINVPLILLSLPTSLLTAIIPVFDFLIKYWSSLLRSINAIRCFDIIVIDYR